MLVNLNFRFFIPKLDTNMRDLKPLVDPAGSFKFKSDNVVGIYMPLLPIECNITCTKSDLEIYW